MRLPGIRLSRGEPAYDCFVQATTQNFATADGRVSLEITFTFSLSLYKRSLKSRAPCVPYSLNGIIVAYNRDADIPLPDREVLLRLFAHEKLPD